MVVKEAGSATSEMLLDDTGNIIKTIIYHYYPSPFSTLRYKYDSSGLCIESIQSWSKSADLQKIVYEYDADQHLIKETVHNNGKLLSAYTYTYSKYDQSKNWLVQHAYRNGKLSGISERSITYQQ